MATFAVNNLSFIYNPVEKESVSISVKQDKTPDFSFKLSIKNANSILFRNTLHIWIENSVLQYNTLDSEEQPVSGSISNEILGYDIDETTTVENLIALISQPVNCKLMFNIYNFADQNGHVYKHTERQKLVFEAVKKDEETKGELVSYIINQEEEIKRRIY